MTAIETMIKASHLIDMDDIIREGHPTLRAVAEEVTFPLSDENILLGEKNDAISQAFTRPCHG